MAVRRDRGCADLGALALMPHTSRAPVYRRDRRLLHRPGRQQAGAQLCLFRRGAGANSTPAEARWPELPCGLRSLAGPGHNVVNIPNEALPQTDEVYAEDGALIAIANDKVDSDRACRDDALNIRARSSVGRKTRGRPESGMSVARSVADVLRDHVVLELEAIDRMYLNVYVPHLQTVGAVVGYLRVHRGQRFASTTAVVPMSEAFVRNIEQFVDDEGIDLVSFRSENARMMSRRDTWRAFVSARACSMSARPRKRRGSCGRSAVAAGSLAQHIRGSWNPPRWSTTTISIALTRTSDRSS